MPHPGLPSFLALLLAVPTAALAQTAGENRALAPSTYDAIHQRLAGAANLVVHAPDTLYSQGLGAASFTYGADGQRYGGGVAVWNLTTGALVWEIHEDSDYPVQSSHWMDLNGDGRPDFLSRVGEENFFSTTLYINGLHQIDAYDSAGFVAAFHSEEAYATFVDLDHDGIPEVVTPGEPADSGLQEMDGPCQGLVIPQDLAASAMKEYLGLAGRFAQANFTYGATDYAPLTLHLLSPIRVYRIQTQGALDVTAAYAGHLRWRSDWLRSLLANAPASCRQPLRHLRTYLDSQARGR